MAKRLQRKISNEIQTIMKLHGGIEHAVESLISVNNSYPWYAYYDLDWLCYTIVYLDYIELKKLISCSIFYCQRIFSSVKSKEKTF
ncbi:hypothetical protein I4U23_012457 [Adineta vaga]|nr:hypothetical protein I4U23_012457 [Adineta vaga]